MVDWTGHDAINELDQGRATNTLTVEAGSDQVRFLVNDTEVSTQPRSAVDTDGITGLRVNHFLNVHIDNLNLVPWGSPPVRRTAIAHETPLIVVLNWFEELTRLVPVP